MREECKSILLGFDASRPSQWDPHTDPVAGNLARYLPAGSEGKATDLSFLSSAAERQFFTVFSSWSSHLSVPHWGTLQWMMKRAAIPLAWLTATGGGQTHGDPRHNVAFTSNHLDSFLRLSYFVVYLLLYNQSVYVHVNTSNTLKEKNRGRFVQA